jgi:hypothetical protein
MSMRTRSRENSLWSLLVAASLPLAGAAFAQVAPDDAAPADTAPSAPAGPGSPSQPSANPPHSPNVLDGLESLKLAKDPDFGPPIFDGSGLFAGESTFRAPAKNVEEFFPLNPILSAPDFAIPSLDGGIEAPALSAPNEKLPSLDFPLTFGPSMVGLSAEAVFGPPMRQLPLGTIGQPSFLAGKHSFVIGNSRVRYSVTLDTAVAYNNNVFGTSTNTKGDMLLTLQPTISLETGKKGSIRFLWAPSFFQYSKYKELGSVNQTFAFSSRYRWSKLRVGLDASYLAQSGLFLNSQGQGEQKAVYARLFAGYALTKKTDLSLAFDGSGTEATGGGKQFQGMFSTSVDYRLTQKTSVGLGVIFGYDTSTAGSTTTESFLLRLLYNPTSKLVFRGEGGLQFRQSVLNASGSRGASAVTSIMDFSLLYRPSPKTYVSLRFYRNVDMDAFDAGNLQITTSVEASATWKLTHAARLDAAVAAGKVESVTLSGQDSENYDFAQANLGMSYFLSDEVNIRLFNNTQQRLRDTLGYNYLSNTSGMSLGLRF